MVQYNTLENMKEVTEIAYCSTADLFGTDQSTAQQTAAFSEVKQCRLGLT